jgi:hypothetical protein
MEEISPRSIFDGRVSLHLKKKHSGDNEWQLSQKRKLRREQRPGRRLTRATGA